jgi:isopentenyl-diphosphate delta-isomerase
MEEILTLVDENDNEIGRETREKCHLGKGKMHRAIAIFLFNNSNLMLIQQRSQKKLLWPEFWDCTVATHVYPYETYESAAERGLKQELGISAKVKKILAFTYFAPFGKHAENEYCALLIGRYDGDVTPIPSEVSGFDYVSLKELKENIARKEDVYTPWFRIAMEKFLAHPASKGFW